MEEDTVMHDGDESDYPDPNNTYSTPYPSLSQNGYATPETERPSLPENEALGTPAPPLTSAPAYTSLADYFKLGNIGRRLDPALRDETGNQDINENPLEANIDVEPEPQHRPWTNAFFNSYASSAPSETSLPGFHALPETDRLVGDLSNRPHFKFATSPADPLSIPDEQPRSRGRPRGPRGTSGRGIEKARGGRQRGRPRRGYKWAIRGTPHEDLFKTPRLPRDKTSGRRGRKPGPTGGKHVDPGEEFKEFQSLAMTAFLDGDYDEAIKQIWAAITANPEVYAAHSLMAQIKEKQGLELDAAIAWQNGAVTKRDPAIWVKAAERFLALEGEDENQSLGIIKQAIECYRMAIFLDKHNAELRAKKMQLHLELEDWKEARQLCKSVVQLQPADLSNVRTYAFLLDKNGVTAQLDAAAHAYEVAFGLHVDDEFFEDVDELWDHLNVYLDVMNRLRRPREGAYQLRRLARWILGRKEDSFWDQYVDDREYDSTHERRAELWQFQQGRITRDNSRYGEGLPLEIRVKLGLFRVQLGAFHHSEALKHLEHLRRVSNEIDTYADSFFDVAECLRKHGMPAAAINFYEPIKSLPELLNHQFWTGLGQCHRVLGQYEAAIPCYEAGIELSKDDAEARVELIKLYIAVQQNVKAFALATEVSRMGRLDALKKENINLKNLNPKAKSGRVRNKTKKQEGLSGKPLLESNDRPRNGSYSGSRVIVQNGDAEFDVGHDFDEEVSQTGHSLDRTQMLEEQKARVQTAYSRLHELSPSLKADQLDAEKTQQWIQHASALSKEFRETKEFFPTRTRDKYFAGLRAGAKIPHRTMVDEMETLRKRLQDSAMNDEDLAAMRAINADKLDEFHGVSFAEWHRILSNLALAYANDVEQDRCYDVLQNILLRANIFVEDRDLMDTSLAICICCALMFNDTKFMSETAQLYDSASDNGASISNQLIAASGRLGYGDLHFYHRNTQHWAQLRVKEQDYLAMTPEMRSKQDWGKDSARLNQLANKSAHTLTDLDPGILATYGHINSNRHGGSDLALSYLFRALAIQPENLVVNLSIATTYVRQAMQNSTENKQYTIAQGLAFLYRYYDLRVVSGKARDLQEAEYNVARMWHMLGLNHLAVPAYEKVLKLSGQVQEESKTDDKGEHEVENFAQEAAFALRHLFVAAGNVEAARAITEEWLLL